MTRSETSARAAPDSSRAAAAEKKNHLNQSESRERPTLIKPVPMKPRRGLLMLLLIVFVCWVGWLVAIYFTTVRPRHHDDPGPASAPALAALR